MNTEYLKQLNDLRDRVANNPRQRNQQYVLHLLDKAIQTGLRADLYEALRLLGDE